MYPKIFRSPELIAKRKSKEERRGWGENLSRAIKPVNRIWVENCLNKGDTGRLFSHYRCSRPLNDALVGFYTGEESVSRQLNANFRQHARLSPISSEPPWFHVVLFPVTRFHLSTPPITLSLPLSISFLIVVVCMFIMEGISRPIEFRDSRASYYAHASHDTLPFGRLGR